jgi:hypothetical protein
MDPAVEMFGVEKPPCNNWKLHIIESCAIFHERLTSLRARILDIAGTRSVISEIMSRSI